MRILVLLLPGMLLLPGCLPEFLDLSAEPETQLVSSSPFGMPRTVPQAAMKVSYEPAKSQDVALRVVNIGERLLQANPEIGLKPFFGTYGTTTPELFHTGPGMIHITEGLVQKCQSDGQLAALLAQELAKMVVAREALATPRMRAANEQPPMEVPIGNSAQRGEFDPVRQAELARYEERHPPRSSKKPLPLPDPVKLATGYLERAGYNPTELTAIEALLDEAQRNYVLEKQVKQSTGGSQWQAAPK